MYEIVTLFGLLKVTLTVTEAPAASDASGKLTYGAPSLVPLLLSSVTPAGRPCSRNCRGPFRAAPLTLVKVLTKKILSRGKFPAYNRSSVERTLFRTMKLHVFRSVSALAVAVILSACGGGQADQPTQTAAAVLVSGQSGTAAQVAAAMPAPDCAADGCKSLRIIDANAEAYRYDAMRRAAADQAAGDTNSSI